MKIIKVRYDMIKAYNSGHNRNPIGHFTQIARANLWDIEDAKEDPSGHSWTFVVRGKWSVRQPEFLELMEENQ